LKIGLFTSDLGKGGAERVMSLMANYWSSKGNEVIFFTAGNAYESYFLENRVNRVSFNFSNSKSPWAFINNTRKKIGIIAEALVVHQVDCLVSFTTACNILACYAAKRASVPLVISDRVTPELDPIPVYWKMMRKIAYRKASCLVLQTQGVLRCYSSYNVRKVIINNSISEIPVRQNVARKNIIINVARLEPQKNHKLLIRAFSKTKNPDWRLQILGDGSERNSLLELVSELGLHDRVDFLGVVDDVFTYLYVASIFVLSSNYEGYPNSLLEGMATGLACISTSCDFGPSEIIDDYKNGILTTVGKVEEMTRVLEEVMEDEDLRKELGSRAESIKDKLKLDTIMGQWDAILEDFGTLYV